MSPHQEESVGAHIETKDGQVGEDGQLLVGELPLCTLFFSKVCLKWTKTQSRACKHGTYNFNNRALMSVWFEEGASALSAEDSVWF